MLIRTFACKKQRREIKMTMPVENDGTWNMYRDIVEQSPELEEEIFRLQVMLEDADDLYQDICHRYCGLPGWEFLESQVSMAIGNMGVLLGVLPGYAEKPESYSPNKLIREYLPHLVEREQ